MIDKFGLNMVNKTSVSPSPLVKSELETSFSQVLLVIILLIVTLATFTLQNRVVGLEPGYDDFQPKHHGWVTANTLAIISKATPEHFFVGYALAFKNDQNVVQYEYFDRYPVFFSALFNRVLSLANNLADQLYLAKQIMNFIFVATFLVAFLIIDKLIQNKLLALTVVLLAFANPYLLWYKDMVHFDQPALLGFLFLIYAIALYKIDGKKTLLYAAPFIAVGLGRGYASYSILFLWLALESFLILGSKELDLRGKFNRLVRHPSFLLLVLALVWGASLLFYNIAMEARIRDVSIIQTSIVRSARYRLSLNPEFNLENEGVINWRMFTEDQIERILQWTFPFQGVNFGPWANALILAVIFSAIGLMLWRQPLEKRMIYLLLTLSGFGWLIPLRNLAAFHDYTAMYYIGIPLVFFLSLLTFFGSSRRIGYFLSILALIVYVSSLIQVKTWHEERAGKANQYTYDFVRIREKIDGPGRNINMPEMIPYGPFTPGFYLSEHYLTSPDIADYVVTRNKKYPGENLTLDNGIIFLFRK
jgi:hypothetical protein